MRKLVLFSLLTAALLISACGVVVTPAWEVEPTEVGAAPTQEELIRVGEAEAATAVTEAPTATQEPPTATATQVPPTATQAATEIPATAPVEATTAPEQASAPASDDPITVLAAMYDPAEGEVLFNQQTMTGYACSSCHLVNSEQQLIGPGLLNIATHGATRVPGEGAGTYIYNSIMTPSAYVVPGFPDMLMPQNFGQVFTEDQIYSIIAYVLTLQSEPSAAAAPAEATPVPTEVPAAAVEPTAAPDQAAAPAGEDPVAVLVSLYDPAEGEMLFNQQTATGYACSSCHLVNSEQQLIGPGLLNISTHGATRVAGEGAATYILNSILTPSAYLVPGFPDMLMPQTFAQVFTEDQIYSIIAYVLTLNG